MWLRVVDDSGRTSARAKRQRSRMARVLQEDELKEEVRSIRDVDKRTPDTRRTREMRMKVMIRQQSL